MPTAGRLFRDLEQTGALSEVFIVHGFHKVLDGRNGEGDPWPTDGDLYAGVIKRGREGQNTRGGPSPPRRGRPARIRRASRPSDIS
jgi:hypothetical protein